MAITYKIGEAATLLNLKTYVLRYWETEFSQIAPLRTEKGQRLYSQEHMALLERIRYLLHERGLTIEGARKILAEESTAGTVYSWPSSQQAAAPAFAHSSTPSPLAVAPNTAPVLTTQPAPQVGTSPITEPSVPSDAQCKKLISSLTLELEAVASLLRNDHTRNLS